MKKKHVILIAVLTAGLAFVQAQSGGTVVQGSSLADKFAWLNAFAQSNTSYVIEVNANESIANPRLSYSGKENITITLRGVGANRIISGRFTVSFGVTLVLDNNITIRDGIWVNRGALIMNNGSTISGNTASENGDGVYIERRNGTFTKTGGTITGYASDQRNGNTVKNSSGAVQNYRGHAVYAPGPKIREGTAGPEVNLSYENGQASGAWDN